MAKKTLKFTIHGAIDFNANDEHVKNHLKSYRFFCQFSTQPIPDGSRDFSQAENISVESLLPLVTIQDSFTDLNTLNSLGFAVDDVRLQASIRSTDIDSNYTFIPVESMDPLPNGKVILVPEFNTSDWSLFEDGERHKFILTRAEWQGWRNGKYHYVWAVAYDANGNPESQSAFFQNVYNSGHFDVGLLLEDVGDVGIEPNQDAAIFDFVHDLLGSPNATAPLSVGIQEKRDVLGVDFGKELTYQISTGTLAGNDATLRTNVLIDDNGGTDSELTVVCTLMNVQPPAGITRLFGIYGSLFSLDYFRVEIEDPGGDNVQIRFYPNANDSGVSIFHTMVKSDLYTADKNRSITIGATHSRKNQLSYLSINGGIVAETSLDVPVADTGDALKFIFSDAGTKIGYLRSAFIVPDFRDPAELSDITSYMQFEQPIQSQHNRVAGKVYGLNDTEVFTPENVKDAGIPQRVRRVLEKSGRIKTKLPEPQ